MQSKAEDVNGFLSIINQLSLPSSSFFSFSFNSHASPTFSFFPPLSRTLLFHFPTTFSNSLQHPTFSFDPNLWYQISKVIHLNVYIHFNLSLFLRSGTSLNYITDMLSCCCIVVFFDEDYWEGSEGGVQCGASDGDDVLGSEHKRFQGSTVGERARDCRRRPFDECQVWCGVCERASRGFL